MFEVEMQTCSDEEFNLWKGRYYLANFVFTVLSIVTFILTYKASPNIYVPLVFVCGMLFNLSFAIRWFMKNVLKQKVSVEMIQDVIEIPDNIKDIDK